METKDRQFLEHMHAAALRMRKLIHDLLQFSHINRDHVAFGTVNLQQVMHEMLHDMDVLIQEKKAQITVAQLPSIEGDERMLRQLFQNIIGNAIKYAKAHTPPELSISVRQNKGRVDITFRDNGIGFDQQYLPKMFTLFQRLHSREAYEGTGLGLAICHKIVEIHNGKIWADSQEGQGAAFFVSLPIEQNKS